MEEDIAEDPTFASLLTGGNTGYHNALGVIVMPYLSKSVACSTYREYTTHNMVCTVYDFHQA